MDWLVEIKSSDDHLSFDAGQINMPIQDIHPSKLYYIAGTLTREEIQKSIDLLFKDPLTEKEKIYKMSDIEKMKENPVNTEADRWEVEVFYKKEVTDPATSYILKALNDISIKADNVRTGYRYVIKGKLNLENVKLFARRYLANLIVQDMYIKSL